MVLRGGSSPLAGDRDRPISNRAPSPRTEPLDEGAWYRRFQRPCDHSRERAASDCSPRQRSWIPASDRVARPSAPEGGHRSDWLAALLAVCGSCWRETLDKIPGGPLSPGGGASTSAPSPSHQWSAGAARGTFPRSWVSPSLPPTQTRAGWRGHVT